MEAIETIYKGYRFRSRLEARWAVFFDAIGISWEYEKEGFVLDDGTKYLPDFWLPDSQEWLEVKPKKFTEVERKKCEFLAKDKSIILAAGLPEPKSYERLSLVNQIYECDTEFQPTGDAKDIIISDYIFLFYHRDEKGNWELAFSPDANFGYSEWENACLLAKQARFEFGERV